MGAKVLASCPCRVDSQDIRNVSTQIGTNPGLSVHISQLFIAIQEEPAGGRHAHCPSLPRPSAACVTAFVTVFVTVSVTSFTTLFPVSWVSLKLQQWLSGRKDIQVSKVNNSSHSLGWSHLERPVGCGSLTGSCPGGVCGAEGSTAPGGMHSNLLLFLQTACISPTISETEHLLVDVLPTHVSFFCELPVYTFWSFLYWAIISFFFNIFIGV